MGGRGGARGGGGGGGGGKPPEADIKSQIKSLERDIEDKSLRLRKTPMASTEARGILSKSLKRSRMNLASLKRKTKWIG